MGLKNEALKEFKTWSQFLKGLSKKPEDWGGVENEELVAETERFFEEEYGKNFESPDQILSEIESGPLNNSVAGPEESAAMILSMFGELIPEKAAREKTDAYRAIKSDNRSEAVQHMNEVRYCVLWEEALLELAEKYGLPEISEAHDPVQTARLLADVDAYLAGKIDEATEMYRGSYLSDRDRKKLHNTSKKSKRAKARRYEHSSGEKKERVLSRMDRKCQKQLSKRKDRIEKSHSAMKDHVQKLEEKLS